LINLKKTCAQKTQEHEASVKARQEETMGISEAIKILNNDDALELMKKTMPDASAAASFVQTRMVRLHKEAPQRTALSFLAVRMETSQPQIDLGPLKKSVEDVIASMKEGQADDDAKLQVCKSSLAETAKEISGLSEEDASMTSKLATLKDQVAVVQEEMKAGKVSITEIDGNMVEAATQRTKENKEFTQVSSELTMSLDLLMKARAVLERTFAKKESFVQVRAASSFADSLSTFLQDAPEAAPELAAPSSQGAAGAGVIGMLNTIAADIKAEQAATKKEEADAQADFEEASSNMQAVLKATKKDVVGKEAEASRIAETLQDLKTNMAEVSDEKDAAQSKEHALHADCDFLVQNYEERKKARTDEIESVGRALAILSGAQ